MRSIISAIFLLTITASSYADDKVEAAVGGGIGGAVGAVVGDELGDRKGAIIGAGVGAAVGTAIATSGEDGKARSAVPADNQVTVVVRDDGPPAHGKHCPPGQAKKGRC
jgi:hypothetical protein